MRPPPGSTLRDNESLDPPTDEVEQAAIEEAWKVEIERRIEEIDRGEVELIPGRVSDKRL